MLSPVLDALQCRQCHHQLKQPVALRCGHTVCSADLSPSSACPISTCADELAAAVSADPANPSVTFLPLPPTDPNAPAVQLPSTDPRGSDVTLSSVLALVHHAQQRLATRARHSDDEDSDHDHDQRPPRKRRRCLPQEPSEDEDDEPDLLTHLRARATITRNTAADQPLPPTSTTIGNPILTEFEKNLLQELSCSICSSLFYMPVTTPCQHTFCLQCLLRTMDHGPKCPICRSALPNFRTFIAAPPNQVIVRIIMCAFPEIYESRRAQEEADDREARKYTALVKASLIFPGFTLFMRIVEPKHRLIIRRALECDDPVLGIIPSAEATGWATPTYGCLMRIISIQHAHDGRSVVGLKGVGRFSVRRHVTMDGYDGGTISIIQDCPDDFIDAVEAVNSPLNDLDADAHAQRSPTECMATHGETSKEGSESGETEDRSTFNLPVTPSDPPSVNSSSPTTTNRAPRPMPSQGVVVRDQSLASSSALPPRVSSSASPVISSDVTVSTSTSSSSPAGTPAAASPPSSRLTNAEIIRACRDFYENLENGTAPWITQRLIKAHGPIPEDDGLIAYYMGLGLPLAESERAKLLVVRSERLRLLMVYHWIQELSAHWWFHQGCNVL